MSLVGAKALLAGIVYFAARDRAKGFMCSKPFEGICHILDWDPDYVRELAEGPVERQFSVRSIL
jgi:hypothetical protein